MVAPSAFKVLTEFKFEIGSALLASKQLTGEVDKISNAANNVLGSFERLSIGIAANLGLGGGGFLGVATKAIQAAEKFRDAQLGFATVISGNLDHFTGNVTTFNDRLGVSSQIIKDIVSDAKKFGLPETELLNMTKLLGAQLAPKGLAGENFDVARGLGRNLLKSAPVLGIDPTLVEGQLLRTIEGSASLGDTLFRRLVGETSAMKQFGGGDKGTKAFNALDAAKRVSLLSEALNQFTRDTDVLKDRMNSLSGQMNILQSVLAGVDGILRPFGEKLRATLVAGLQYVNRVLDTDGRRIVNSLTTIVSEFLENPKALIINLMQLKNLSSDMQKTGNAFGTAGMIGGIGWVLSKLTGIARFAHPAIAGVSLAMSVLADAAGRIPDPFGKILVQLIQWGTILGTIAAVLTAFGKFSWVLTGLGVVLRFILLPLGLMLTAFQIISRAVAIARVQDAEALPGFLANLSEAFAKLKAGFDVLIMPFSMFFNALAEAIAPMFRMAFYADPLLNFITSLANAMTGLGLAIMRQVAIINGAIAAMASIAVAFEDKGFLGALKDPSSLFGGAGDAFNREFETFLAESLGKGATAGDAKNLVAKNQINIGTQKIDIRQSFREQQEPDRIAFTIKDQLMKAATNPLQSKGRSIGGAFSGGLAPAGN